MIDRSHLNALEDRLIRERERLRKARTPQERELRAVWVAQTEREIAGERAFLGLPPEEPMAEMTDEELLAELRKE